MHIRWLLAFIVSSASLHGISFAEKSESMDINHWTELQKGIAMGHLLDNVGDSGKHTKNINPGCIIASPSDNVPNYYFQWVRDSALTIMTVIDRFLEGDQLLDPIIIKYMDEMVRLQKVKNPSGDFYSGGLGEPKFHTDGSSYEGDWGRPQNDSPALRAMAFIKYLNHRFDHGTEPHEVVPYIEAVLADLDYTVSVWEKPSFDLWEEIQDVHYFTLSVQKTALQEGAAFAMRIGARDQSTLYAETIHPIDLKLGEFWDHQSGIIKGYKNIPNRSGLDCSVLLASLYSKEFDTHTLPTLKKLQESMTNSYAVNQGHKQLIGRYLEDVYDGVGSSIGNPWFLCTHSAAEVIYKAIQYYDSYGLPELTNHNIQFFVEFAEFGDPYNWPLIRKNMIKYADKFLQDASEFHGPNGSMSEQISRVDGKQMGALDLTWSYSSLLNAIYRREAIKRTE
ncbi:glucan-alpha-1,4-glucosidase [Schizosaccharomyces osmophilus]|uniref:glucan 1,4-alpha-glucosidase n=1 Tax=Schizosaccharomyces osmophilus TaxID=2545709 RepID=A0AAE9WA63_9SCHI|nr:glucan-alpha-1,4-glucosidase [Schizosaccharomyces osmophilus]WBW70823.1 glucan-alpha-1,4-glucosidase [Schizosaccharomyces osmophilus]